MTEEEIAAAEAADKQAAEDKAAKEAEEARIREEAKKAAADEKPKTTDAEAKLLKEVMKLKEKAKAEEDLRKKLEQQYSGIDLEAARSALKAAEEAEEKELERKGEYERLLNKQKEKADALLEVERNRAKEMEEKLQTAMRAVDELSLGNAFANSKFIQDKLALTANKTRALYSSHFDIVDGKLVAFDKPKGAVDRTQLIDASANPLSFDDALADIINSDPDKEYLLKVEARSGAGSKPNQLRTDLDNGNRPVDSISKIAQGLANPANFAPDSIEKR